MKVLPDEVAIVTGALYFADGGISIGSAWRPSGTPGEQVPEELRKQPSGAVSLQHEGLENIDTHRE